STWVWLLRTTIAALGIMLPLTSVTVPLIVAAVDTCAQPRALKQIKHKEAYVSTAMRRTIRDVCAMACSLHLNSFLSESDPRNHFAELFAPARQHSYSRYRTRLRFTASRVDETSQL